MTTLGSPLLPQLGWRASCFLAWHHEGKEDRGAVRATFVVPRFAPVSPSFPTCRTQGEMQSSNRGLTQLAASNLQLAGCIVVFAVFPCLCGEKNKQNEKSPRAGVAGGGLDVFNAWIEIYCTLDHIASRELVKPLGASSRRFPIVLPSDP